MSAVIAAYAPAPAALGLLAATLAASLGSQVLLRERYEQATGDRRQATGLGSVPGQGAAATGTVPTDKLIADG
jgi:hypothetical protein